MYDMAVPNVKPGVCAKCSGSGLYRWGAINNGVAEHSGRCHSCQGTGEQTQKDIGRNRAYNRYKMARIGV